MTEKETDNKQNARRRYRRCKESGCSGEVILADHEFVCVKCGTVNAVMRFSGHLPLSQPPMPPPCICGNPNMTIYREKHRIVALCTRNPICKFKRYYYYGSNRWTDVRQGYRVKGRKNPSWEVEIIDEANEKYPDGPRRREKASKNGY